REEQRRGLGQSTLGGIAHGDDTVPERLILCQMAGFSAFTGLTDQDVEGFAGTEIVVQLTRFMNAGIDTRQPQRLLDQTRNIFGSAHAAEYHTPGLASA